MVEIVAYLKNKWKKGRFPFSISPIYLLGNRRSFLFLETNEQKRKNEQKKKLFSTSFLFFFFFFLSTHTGLVSSVIMLAAVKEGDAKKLAELIRQDPEHGGGWRRVHLIARGLRG